MDSWKWRVATSWAFAKDQTLSTPWWFVYKQWRKKISMLHLKSDRHDLTTLNWLWAFHLVMLNFYLFISPPLLQWCKAFLDVSMDRTFWTSQSLNILFSSFSRLISASRECLKLRFRQEHRKNSLLELWIFSFRNEKSSAFMCNQLDHFERDFGIDFYMFFLLIFFPITLDFNFYTYISLILWILFNFSLFTIKFSLSGFHPLISPWELIQNEWFFILWINLGYFFLKLLISLIYLLNELFDLIKFWIHLKKIP